MPKAAPPTPDSADEKNQSTSNSLFEVVSVVAVAVAAALLIQAFVVKPYRIPSESMLPTLQIGQRILVNRVEGRFGTPERGDVVVFMPPGGSEEPECGVVDGQHYEPGLVFRDGDDVSSGFDQVKMPCPVPAPGKFEDAYVKRVVGMPGDSISVKRGRVWINGSQLPEPYLPGTDDCRNSDDINTDCNFPNAITVPAGHYFMMGDNRNDAASYDSRYWGPIPESSVIGEAFFTYWPLNKLGSP
jgi:signal peptidase I